LPRSSETLFLTMWRDLFWAARQIRRQPLFALAIVLTLGSSMGVNATLFSIFNGTMLRPWAIHDPARVVVIHTSALTTPEIRYWSEHSTGLSHIVTIRRHHVAWTDGRRLAVDLISTNYFEAMGVPMVRGRGFVVDDGDAARSNVAIISHRTWDSSFARDEGIVGRLIHVNGRPFRVAGVAAPGFDGSWSEMRRVDLWIPSAAARRLAPAGDLSRDDFDPGRDVVAARLAGHSSLGAAASELSLLSRQYRTQHEIDPTPVTLTDTTPYASFAKGGSVWVDVYMTGVFLAITFVTLLACASVANLLLARGFSRRGEIAVRLSLGAGRWLVIRQLLVEALMLSALASVVGLAISVTLPASIFAALPDLAETQIVDFSVDRRLLLYSVGLSVVACVAFGLAPALHSSRVSISHGLKDAHGLSAPSLKTSLPAYQVMISVILLVVAGLLVRSVQLAQTKDHGYSLDGVAVMKLEFASHVARDERWEIQRQMRGELERFVGPGAFAEAGAAPGAAGSAGIPTQMEIRDGAATRIVDALRLQVTSAYFSLLRIPIVTGRAFDRTDSPDRAIVVNQAFAQQYWPGVNPLGKTLAWDRSVREVVGVVRDAHVARLDAIEPLVFQPLPDHTAHTYLIADTAASVAREIRSVAERFDAAVHVDVVPGTEWSDRIKRRSLAGAKIIGGLGAFAVLLAAFGLFTVSAYTVQQRTRELGIRAALGAGPRQILETVLTPAIHAAARGCTAGTVGAIVIVLALRHWLYGFYGLSVLDPITYGGVAITLATATFAAVYLPARRATRSNPMAVLRYD
jgi:putative ABC transport system permease protein